MTSLSPFWDLSEIKAILKQVWEEILGKSHSFPLPNVYDFSNEQLLKLADILNRLKQNEPLQYILEKAYFLDFEIKVNSSVLIPRPETEELVLWVLETKGQHEKSVLDLCTGSGCIALALARLGKWKSVSGLDVSTSAIQIARENEKRLNLKVDWLELDLLKHTFPAEHKWDVWVSNPPYVLNSESGMMDPNVLKFEPGLALFVPDNDPLLFYKIIINLATKHLSHEGVLFFELNHNYAKEVKQAMEAAGFQDLELKQDMFGKNRMVKGTWRPI
jgi:release factor glutamine methyltransferase